MVGWRRWTALAAVVVGVGLTALLLSSGLRHDPNRLPSTLVGRQAPDFDLNTIDGGQRVHLAELRGEVVILNFWASWCVACQIEEPALREAFERYGDRGVTLLGVSFQDSATNARAYAARRGIPWILLDDPGSRTGLAYGVTGLPETYFIARDGRVSYKAIGPVNQALVNQQLRGLLAGGAA